MTTKIFLTVMVVVCYAVVCRAWLFRKGRLSLRDEKNCFCKAVNNHNYDQIIRDFGSIQRCRAFPTCSCRRAELMTCGTECDRKVKEWVCLHNCGGGRNGIKVRASFQASTCHSNTAHNIYECGSQVNCGH